MSELVILGRARTEIGMFGGTLISIILIELAAVAAKAVLERSDLYGGQIGCAINTETQRSVLQVCWDLGENTGMRVSQKLTSSQFDTRC